MGLLIRTNQVAGVPLNNNIPSLFAASPTEITVVNTTTLTAVFSKNIAGGILSTNGALRITMAGIVTNTSGGAINLSVIGGYGGVSVGSIAISIPNGTTNQPVIARWLMKNAGATNSQKTIMELVILLSAFNTAYTTSAIDSTVLQNVNTNVAWGTASPSASYTGWYNLVEYIKAQ